MGKTASGFQITFAKEGMTAENQTNEVYVKFNVVRPSDGLAYTVGVDKCPTGNCQLTSVAYTNLIATITNNNVEQGREIIKECYGMIKYKWNLLILLDVNQQYMEYARQLASQVVHEHEYVSSNGSKMCLFLIRLG